MALYLFLAFISACARYPIALLQLRLAKTFDSDFCTYSPGVKREHSVAYGSEMFFSHNPRVLIATWIAYPLIPIYWIVQCGFILSYLLARGSHFFDYGVTLKRNKSKYPHYFN